MPEPIHVYGFETSNNMKVRVALGYKAIPYEFHTIDPAERDEIVRLSGQRLTPVLKHGDLVLFDSATIIRYLEGNFPDTPSLLGNDRDEQWAIEDWELFARATLAGPMMKLVHLRVAGGTVDDRMKTQCDADFANAAAVISNRLRDRPWLVGESMTLADVTAAPIIYRVQKAKMLPMPPGSERVGPWIDRVMRFDAVLAR